jgi:hypothetical protein
MTRLIYDVSMAGICRAITARLYAVPLRDVCTRPGYAELHTSYYLMVFERQFWWTLETLRSDDVKLRLLET